jgi:single-stranded DNA-specific DHH superfamily exonuclease
LANRLLQEYEKPVAVFSPSKKDPNVLVGSIRSKEGFNVLKALEGTKTPLTKGGHAFAGGVSIKVEDFATFKKDFLFAALKHKLTPQKEKLIPLNERGGDPGKLTGYSSNLRPVWPGVESAAAS